MELNYASKGVANAGLATGIVGTTLGALNSMGGLGALAFGAGARPYGYGYGYGYGNDNWNDHGITRYEFSNEIQYSRDMQAKDLLIAKLEAEKVSDERDIEVYKQLRGEIKELQTNIGAQIAMINQNLGAQAVINQANKDGFQIAQERLDVAKAELGGAIERERQTRKANDNLIVTYANATFYPKEVAAITVGSAHTPQPTYNPLPDCDCNC